jgi:hypothetical protein
MAPIPPSIIGVVSPILAEKYTHAQLNSVFMAMGFPGDPPEGNKIEKMSQLAAPRECAEQRSLEGLRKPHRRVHGC